MISLAHGKEGCTSTSKKLVKDQALLFVPTVQCCPSRTACPILRLGLRMEPTKAFCLLTYTAMQNSETNVRQFYKDDTLGIPCSL
jgi:hypothetical protein